MEEQEKDKYRETNYQQCSSGHEKRKSPAHSGRCEAVQDSSQYRESIHKIVVDWVWMECKQ